IKLQKQHKLLWVDAEEVASYIVNRQDARTILQDKLALIISSALGEGIVQKELAEYMGVRVEWIGRIIFSGPSYSSLVETCHALGLSTRKIIQFDTATLRQIGESLAYDIEAAKLILYEQK